MRSLHPFTRTISRQASTLMMVQFPANFILQFFGAPGPISNLLRGSVFVYFLYCVFFGALGSLRGRVADLPAIGAGAPTFPRSGSMFRGGLRGGFRGRAALEDLAHDRYIPREVTGGNSSPNGSALRKLEGRQCPYLVGKRYKVARPLELWSSETFGCSNLDGTRLETLKAKKDIILLVQISEQTGCRRGYVIPQPAEIHEAGWISLEDTRRGKSMQPPLLRLELPGSWDLKARYCVQNPATLRAGPALDSDWIGELNAGCEELSLEFKRFCFLFFGVLLLDFGVTSGGSSGQIGKARLRALVFAGDKIGWMSPETGSGDHLLKPVNLLSRKVVDMHKQTLRSSGSGVRKSYQQGGNNPWEAGATYRMLEKTPLRSGSDLKSSEVGKAGCPVANIVVQEGPEKGKSGWVRCTAKDGHDVMDTRDHNEYDKIIQKMREPWPQGLTMAALITMASNLIAH
eukprot:g30494.t2